MCVEDSAPTMRVALGAGSLAGGAATVVMSLALLGAQRLHLLGRLPPEEMTSRLLESTDIQATPRTRSLLATALHGLFGLSIGGVFGLLHRQFRLPLPSALQGVVYGCVVWLLSYMGWVPALGLMPAATDDGPRRPLAMVLAHVVYGAVLGALVGQIHTSRSTTDD